MIGTTFENVSSIKRDGRTEGEAGKKHSIHCISDCIEAGGDYIE